MYMYVINKLWKSFIRMVVKIVRKFLYHIQKRNYL